MLRAPRFRYGLSEGRTCKCNTTHKSSEIKGGTRLVGREIGHTRLCCMMGSFIEMKQSR